MTGLTTHVLDTTLGRPASGVVIDLFSVDQSVWHLIKTVSTNDDGRVDGEPLLSGDGFKTGDYELIFHAGDYFRKMGMALSDPPFLDLIPIRFNISDNMSHYHVPLLVSPYSYSTYRGS